MRHKRMPWLLAAVTVLLLLRWFAPLTPRPSPNSVAAFSEPSPRASSLNKTLADKLLTESGNDGGAGSDSPDALIGNAFAPRSPPTPAPIEALVQAAAPDPPSPVAVEAPPPPPPPPSPPLRVIGTWHDGTSPAAFIATPQSTVLARRDSVLMADYRVVGIDSTTVSLLQLSTQLSWTLQIPQN